MIEVIACTHLFELLRACTVLLPWTLAETQAGRRDGCHILQQEPAKSLLAAPCEAPSGRNKG